MIGALISHLLQSTVIASIVGLLTLGFRKDRAEVRYWLWLSASLKFFVPFSLLITLGRHIGLAPAVKTVAVSSVSFRMERLTQPFVYASPSASSTREAIAYWIPLVCLGIWICGVGLITLMRSRGWHRIRGRGRFEHSG